MRKKTPRQAGTIREIIEHIKHRRRAFRLRELPNEKGTGTPRPAGTGTPRPAGTPREIIKTYTTPPVELIGNKEEQPQGVEITTGESIAEFLTWRGVPCQFVDVDISPQLLQYHFNMIDLSRRANIKKALSALSMTLHCEISQEQSKVAHFSIVMTRKQRDIVHFRRALYSSVFDKASRCSAFLGVSTDNSDIVLDFEKSPHVLIAGASGSGKSVCVNTIINSLLYKATPFSVRFVMIDPKKVELNHYRDLPHLLKPIVNSVDEAITTLKEVCDLMDRRFSLMARDNIKDITQAKNKYPRIIVVIDELADLMLRSGTAVEDSIVRISQLGRAAGIHLLIATQRPTVKVITGLIKANMTTRIALQTASMRDSINILDHKGAETLTGKGDGLLKLPSQVETIRFQTAYIGDDDIEKIATYWKGQA